jgi:hypothetical protein
VLRAQILEFIGACLPKRTANFFKILDAKETLKETVRKELQQSWSQREMRLAEAISHRERTDRVTWRARKIQCVASRLVSEIGNSVSAFPLQRWVYANRGNDVHLANLFSLSVWLTPHIQNDAEVGVYSKTTAAFVYRQAAERIPRLLLVAAFAGNESVYKMRSFMESWITAEEMLSDEDVKIIDALDEKDLGAFLYWLLNERQRCWTLVAD